MLPHRCSRCGRRHTFSRHWNLFTRRKSCWFCGNFRFFVDKWMLRRGREQACYCAGYHFPHRGKSLRCERNPKIDLLEAIERTAWLNRWGGHGDE